MTTNSAKNKPRIGFIGLGNMGIDLADLRKMASEAGCCMHML